MRRRRCDETRKSQSITRHTIRSRLLNVMTTPEQIGSSCVRICDVPRRISWYKKLFTLLANLSTNMLGAMWQTRNVRSRGLVVVPSSKNIFLEPHIYERMRSCCEHVYVRKYIIIEVDQSVPPCSIAQNLKCTEAIHLRARWLGARISRVPDCCKQFSLESSSSRSRLLDSIVYTGEKNELLQKLRRRSEKMSMTWRGRWKSIEPRDSHLFTNYLLRNSLARATFCFLTDKCSPISVWKTLVSSLLYKL